MGSHQFFRTKPLACDPSSLPKYPPSKEYDAKLRGKEAMRYALVTTLLALNHDVALTLIANLVVC